VPHAYLSHQSDIAARRNEVKGFEHIPFMRPLDSAWLDS